MAAANLLKFYFSKPVVVILGSTGTGKSKLAIEIAKRFKGEVINADAMQLYRGLDIITNKVTEAEQEGIRHHLLGSVNPSKSLTVLEYRSLALTAIKDIIDRKKLPIIVGGTFYYVEAILFDSTIGTPEIGDESDPDEKLEKELEGGPPRKRLKAAEYEEVKAELDKLDNESLHERLREVDPEYAEKLHPNSRRKILRAILVHLQHGETLTSLIKKQKSQPGGCPTSGPLNFKNSILLWLRSDLEVLQKRLDDRVDDMMSRGLVDELLEFHKKYTAQAPEKFLGFNLRKGIYQSIGFKEFYDYLVMGEENRDSEEGKKTLEKGVEMLKLVTRRYARRQKRWIENRLLKNGQREMPPIYGFDATDVSKWKENVYSPAEDVVASYLEGKTPSLEPLPVKNTKVIIDKMYKCECGTIAAGKVQYENHLKSKNHLRKMKRLLKERRDDAPSEKVESSC